MTNVELVDLTKKFRNVTALHKLTLKIKSGDFVVLLGPSGSGKTTTLRCIAGLEQPDEGEVYFDGKLMNHVPPEKRNVGLVFQNYALFPHMTVYGNISFGLKMRRRPRNEIEEKVRWALKLVKLEGLENRLPAQLSGGQQQRVALARALVTEPNVLLMDEPLSNLDAQLRVYMRAELKKLQSELRITTIYVTHDQIEALTLADKVAVFNNGRLQQYDQPDNLYHRPRNLFVARFIGSPPMNIFEASIEEKSGTTVLDAGHIRIPVNKNLSRLIKNLSSKSEVLVGIRPEDIELGVGDYKGQVVLFEPLGKDKLVHLNVNGLIIRSIAPGHIKTELGSELCFNIPASKIYLFRKDNNESIL